MRYPGFHDPDGPQPIKGVVYSETMDKYKCLATPNVPRFDNGARLVRLQVNNGRHAESETMIGHHILKDMPMVKETWIALVMAANEEVMKCTAHKECMERQRIFGTKGK